MSKKPLYTKLLATLLILFFTATASMGLLSTPNLIHAEETKSLFDRLGGKGAITAVVDEFVNRIVADSRVNGRFGSTDVKRFKQ